MTSNLKDRIQANAIYDDCMQWIDFTYAVLKKGKKKSDIQKPINNFIHRIDRFPKERIPLVALIQKVVNANDMMSFLQSIPQKQTTFGCKVLPIEGKISKATINRYEKAIKETIAPFFKIEPRYVTGKYRKLAFNRQAAELLFSPHIFIDIWTGLECYLEMRIRARAFATKDDLLIFASRIPDKALPKKWIETDEDIHLIEYGTRLEEIIDQYLKFPYHNFREEGKIDLAYRSCFGIHITKYKKIARLQEFAELRHNLVHFGTNYLTKYYVEMNFNKIIELEEIVLEFSEWIENEIKKADKTQSRWFTGTSEFIKMARRAEEHPLPWEIKEGV